MVAITVTRKSQSFVRSVVVPTTAEKLELSAIDCVPRLRHTMRSLHVFHRYDDDRPRHDGARRPAEVIYAVLFRALVEYPMFTSRFVGSGSTGEACVMCTGDSGWFMEVAIGCSLEDMNGLEY